MYKHYGDELKDDVRRAFEAALSSMDYYILELILDASSEAKKAYAKNDFQSMLYSINKCYWDVGVCINEKLNKYTSVMPNFFESISSNICHYLKQDKSIAFSEENLNRCLKLVNLTKESWFDGIACRYQWQYIADAIDRSNSFGELRAHCE